MTRSNREHGEGRSDVAVYDSVNSRAVIFEAKYSRRKEDMEKDCDRAIHQIAERKYAEDLEEDYDSVLCYGISFYKKQLSDPGMAQKSPAKLILSANMCFFDEKEDLFDRQKDLRKRQNYAKISNCDILAQTSLLPASREARDHKEVKSMNKYELAVVLSVKLEDEERAAAIEKVKEVITRFGGTVTSVDEWGKKRLAYEIQKMKEAYYYFIHFDAEATCPAEVEKRVRIMEPVIRYLCVKEEA